MKKHFVISIIKSTIRIGAAVYGAVTLMYREPIVSNVLVWFAVAEIIGIIEEIGE